MATLEELVVLLTAETSSLKAEMLAANKAVTQNTKKMEDAVEAFSKNSNKQLGFFQTAMATMSGFLGSQVVIGAFGLVKDAAGFMADQFTEGMHAAQAEEVALTKLANSLAMSGNYTRAAMDDLTAFTGEMERLTNVGDDVVASNLAILSSLTKLDSEGLKKAQKAALDMSVAFGMDLESATRMVAKGVNGSTEAFKKQGIVIEAGATKAENLSNILRGLAGVSGAAEGVTKTYAGALASLKNSWGNVVEAFAKAVVQNEAVITVFNSLSGVLNSAEEDVNGVNYALKEAVAVGMIMFVEGVAWTIDAIDMFVRGITSSIRALETLGEGLLVPWKLATEGIDGAIEQLGKVKDSASNAYGAFTETTALSDFSTKLHLMGDTASNAFAEAAMGAGSAGDAAGNAGDKVNELTAAQVRYNDAIRSQGESLAAASMALDAEYNFQLEFLKGHLDQKKITEEQYNADRAQIMADQHAAEWAQLEAFKALKDTSKAEEQAAELTLARKHALDKQKLALDQQKLEEQQNKTRAENFKSTMGTIATLAQSSSKELAAIGKAAAITQATIDGFAAVQKALASAPPPFNFALAGLVGAATAANVAKIAGVGLNEGGKVVGGGANVDSVSASLTKGEAVIDRTDTQRLSRFLDNAENGGGSGGKIEIEIRLKDELMDFIETQLIERGRLGQSLQVG